MSKAVELKQGQNQLFTDPDADKAREFFRHKSRAMVNKVTTAEEAVKTMIKDGDYITIGGFGANRIPTAILHEIVRQGKKNLGFAGHTATHDFQILIAGECIDRLDVAYIIGLEARGLSPHARRAVESGKIKLTEWTNATLSWRIKAAAMGLSFLPARNIMGTDTFKYSAAKEILCPFTGQKYAAHPALYPDFAAIHVHECDVYGNAHVYGASVSDQDLAKAAKKNAAQNHQSEGLPEGNLPQPEQRWQQPVPQVHHHFAKNPYEQHDCRRSHKRDPNLFPHGMFLTSS